MKHINSRFIALIIILLPGIGTSILTSAQTYQKGVKLTFGSHLAIAAPEQDVLWRDEDGFLWRVAPEDPLELLEQPLYANKTGAEHDPFRLSDNPLGPYEQGKALGFTLGEWLAASGSGGYISTGDSALLEATFTNLVPNGVYTMWCSRVILPPKFEIINKPCGAADGTENIFAADAHGEATFSIRLSPIKPTTDTHLAVFAIAYHSDGKTYAESPGTFGRNTHTQMIAILPPPTADNLP